MSHVQVLLLMRIDSVVAKDQDDAHAKICTLHHNNHVGSHIFHLHAGRHLWE